MWKKRAILVAVLTLAGGSVVAADAPQTKPATKAPGPCDQIVAACKSSGFVEGKYEQGFGLWVDCIDPIMKGAKQPAKADKPLPTVSSDTVAACRKLHPNFGEGKKAQPKAT